MTTISRYLTCLLATFLFLLPVAAQEWSPELTEVWDPEPEVVVPGDGAQAPSDAIILFDGRDLAAWESTRGGNAGWTVENGIMTVAAGSGDIRTRQSFADVQLHIEWRTPAVVEGDGQGRGNSGVYLQERYEVQILDSFENRTYSNGQAGSIYKQYVPLVNASRGPGTWQSYDIFYRAPVFAEDGELVRPGTITVVHNGVLIHNNVVIQGSTRYTGLPSYEAHGPLPVMLQDHGNPTSFRNIWIREL